MGAIVKDKSAFDPPILFCCFFYLFVWHIPAFCPGKYINDPEEKDELRMKERERKKKKRSLLSCALRAALT